MVARLTRIRLTLLIAEFRGSFGGALRTSLGLLALFALAVAAAVLPARLIDSDMLRATLDVAVGTLLLGGVFFVPFFTNRRHLEPRQFAQYPYGSGTVGVALLLTTVVSWPFLLLLVWLIALGITRPEWAEPAWLAPVVLVGVAVLAMLSARVMSALSKLLIGPDRAGVLRAVGAVLLVAVLPIVVFAVATTLGAGTEALSVETVEVFAWTPFGAPFAGLYYVSAGDSASALQHFGVAAGFLLLLLVLWPVIVAASNNRIDRPGNPAMARRGLGWFERFSARPAPVIGARALTYWARDPRYRIGLAAIPFAPAVMLLAFWIAGAELRPLAMIPLPVILLLFAWSLHNDVAMDSTAIWSHVASGIRGREDRAGRLAPVLLIGVPLVLIGSSLTATVLGDWRDLPAIVGMNFAVLFVTCGVSSVFSALMPYPSTRPGDSPFVQPQWSGSGSGVAQVLSMALSIVLAVPAAWFAVLAVENVDFMEHMWALGFGIGYGLLVMLLGVLIGGRIFERSAPELIAVTQVFD
ncbi:hypothetical protein [Leucobacter sp. GX24907]